MCPGFDVSALDWSQERTYAFCADCMEALRLMPTQYVDLAIVDPPYGNWMALSGGGRMKDRLLSRESKVMRGWNVAPTAEYFDELRRVSRYQIIWGGNYFSLPPTRCFVVWDKVQSWENWSQAEYAWTNFDRPSKIVRISTTSSGDECRIHPTQKPIRLYKWLLQKFAEEGWLILDTHMGSGSSRIAAYCMGFRYIGFEVSEQYYTAACERFERWRAQPLLL